MGQYKKKEPIVEAITFAELIQHGVDSGAQLVNGMPWSFEYKGYPVTMENDSLYFVSVNGVLQSIASDEVIVIDGDEVDVITKSYFEKKYEPVQDIDSLFTQYIKEFSPERRMKLAGFVMLELAYLAIEANARTITMQTSIKMPTEEDRRHVGLVAYQHTEQGERYQNLVGLFHNAVETLAALEDLVADVEMQLSDHPDIDIPSLVMAKNAINEAING